jgi:L-fuconolactonase
MSASGVSGALFVQAFSAYGTDNRFVVASGNEPFGRWASTVYVDISEPDWKVTLQDWVAQGAAGIRIVPDYSATKHELDDPVVLEAVRFATDLNLGIVFTMRRGHGSHLAPILEKFPDVVLALDHCGYPDVSGGYPFEYADPLFQLARYPGVHLKVSTLVLEDVIKANEDTRKFVNRLAEAFGPSRLMWGSNFSASNERSYDELVEFGHFAFSDLSESDRESGLEDGPLRLWPAIGRHS